MRVLVYLHCSSSVISIVCFSDWQFFLIFFLFLFVIVNRASNFNMITGHWPFYYVIYLTLIPVFLGVSIFSLLIYWCSFLIS